MLVTFKTNAYSDITMFGSAAISLLKMMGQSGNVPGAIMADDLPDAIASLEQALGALDVPSEMKEQSTRTSSGGFDDDDKNPAIGLDKRAGPLIDLLKSASNASENVIWES